MRVLEDNNFAVKEQGRGRKSSTEANGEGTGTAEAGTRREGFLRFFKLCLPHSVFWLSTRTATKHVDV
jgi:hypothetical protein